MFAVSIGTFIYIGMPIITQLVLKFVSPIYALNVDILLSVQKHFFNEQTNAKTRIITHFSTDSIEIKAVSFRENTHEET